MTIKSKVHVYGNEKESEWPSQFGTGEKGLFHVDKNTLELKEGYPENPNPKYGEAPIVMFDSMPETYHDAACRPVESRKEWERLDKEYGTLTVGSIDQAKPKVDAFYERKKYKDELRRASKTALDVYRANPKEVRQKLEKQAEEQIKTLKKAGLTKQLKDVGVKVHG